MPRLNKSFVDKIVPAAREEMYFDDALPGFGLRVYPTGRKLYFVQYRAMGRTRRVKVGVHGAVTADEARKLARQRLGEVAKGENPAETIAHERRLPTVANIADRFLTDHVAIRCKPSTAKQYKLLIDGVIKPKLGPRKIDDITRSDIAGLHHDMRDRPYHANRTLSVLSKLFNLSEVWGLRPDGSNPCRHVQRYAERKRERFLSQSEIGRLGMALDETEREGSELPAAINAIRLLLMTGCRLKEILTLKWDYIQPPYLRLPDSKTGARKIPIDQTISDVLAGIAPVEGNPYVIAGTKDGQYLGDLHGPWRRICSQAKLDNVRIHDLRHTYASNALAAGLPIEMVGKLLGHTQIQTTMRYAHLADDPVRQAASMIAGITGKALASNVGKTAVTSNSDGTTGNVVPIRRTAS